MKTEADKVHNENEILRMKTKFDRGKRKQPGILLSKKLSSFEQSIKAKKVETDTDKLYRELLEDPNRVLTLWEEYIDDADQDSSDEEFQKLVRERAEYERRALKSTRQMTRLNTTVEEEPESKKARLAIE